MASIPAVESISLPQRNFSPLAGVLSYLVPGLGQIVQGRIGKGLLFMVCLYALFFYGQYLGGWRNVYFMDNAAALKKAADGRASPLMRAANHLPFFCQFWIGIAAWPAIVQHFTPDDPQQPQPRYFGNYQRVQTEDELNTFLRNSDKAPDLGWMYTIIAGVLNILVIYDALAGPVHQSVPSKPRSEEPAVA